MAKDQVYEVVRNVIMEVLPHLEPEMISIDKNLKELGANSIDHLEVVMISMEGLGLKLPLINFAHVSNIDGLVNMLAENYENTN